MSLTGYHVPESKRISRVMHVDPEVFEDAPCTLPGAADPCSDDRAERARAVTACTACHVRTACQAAYRVVGAGHFVWGGRDITPHTRDGDDR